MNPVLITVGATVLFSTLTLLFFLVRLPESVPGPEQYTYESKDYTSDPTGADVCCICLEDINISSEKKKVVTLPCKHKIHKECLKQLLAQEAPYNNRCPYCRTSFKSNVTSLC